MSNELRKLSKLAFSDTGAILGSTDYVTIFMIHGFGWNCSEYAVLYVFIIERLICATIS
jgi:hypothetical protein